VQDLSTFNNSWYKPGSPIKRFLWYIVSILVFKNGIFPFNTLKCSLLKLFGASVGKGVIIKPYVNIKYPWFLIVQDYVWIGEQVWIDNLAQVTIMNNVCISQGAFLLTGNHDYTVPGFDLFIKPIMLEDGVWIGAKSVVCPGVTAHKLSILQTGSVAISNLEESYIYGGNPAAKIKTRPIKNYPNKF
jgi:putative colanic acid biosynthesis acetyltransferase WcaF